MKDKKTLFQQEAARVARRLRKEIYAGSRLPRERLVESRLAQECSTNRMVIRQALGELASEGLVDLEPYRGASVAAVGIDRIIETFQVVAMLEGYAAKLAAERLTERDLDLLRTNLNRQQRLPDGEVQGFQVLNFEFHRRINRSSGNPLIVRLIRSHSRFTNYWFLSLSSVDLQPAVKAHEKILEALIERNGERARKYMEGHIIFRVNRLVESIKDRIPVGMFRSLSRSSDLGPGKEGP